MMLGTAASSSTAVEIGRLREFGHSSVRNIAMPRLKGTPTIYINGREFDIHQDLNEWIAQETGEAVKPASPASGGATPKPPSSAPAK